MIIVEDGTAISTAQSYVSVEDATTYHTSLGNTEWAERPDLQETSLVKATQLVDAIWGMQYLSNKRTKEQRLLFPRLAFYDNNGDYIYNNEIPRALKDAVCEMALYVMTGTGDALAVSDTAGIKRTKQKIGDLEEEVEYQSTYGQTAKTAKDKYGKVDLLLSSIVAGPNLGMRL